ncbi:hypothetical protein BJY01DRAFT_175953 [Aspergillus pseudoustus]|uniref:Mg2+ transporter protein, CorA-like/Zinc transport protein ZntB n=1 Tax=Aspergillus pseudoustus TaxID=1810923 RepID=A0ABR4K1P5_9EURO
MFQFNRDLAARGIEWTPRRLYFIEAWSFPGVSAATPWNFRCGFLDARQIEEWVYQTGSFAIPAPPPSVGRPDGGLPLLACDYTLFRKISLGMSRDDFEVVESIFGLHPATLPALEVGSGSCSRHLDLTQQRNILSIVLKAPQKYELGNFMLSLTHEIGSGWTAALLAGESIVDGFTHLEDVSLLPHVSYSPCAIIRACLASSTALWNKPLTLPSILLNDHLKRLQQFSSGDLTRRVTYIEEQLGVTKVGRRNSKTLMYQPGANVGKHLERSQAEWLTTQINTQLTRLMFTARAPKWNYEAATLLVDTENELIRNQTETLGLGNEIIQMLDHNISLAKSMEDHVLGLQKRLELQLNVLYSFVAQTDNRLSARLAAVAGRDSTSMKILAFITTIFLPGSYVATLFSMNMFNWEEAASDTVSPRFWIYWVVAGPLTLLTLGGWALWWSFEKNRYDKHLEETMKRANEIKPTPWWRRLLKSQDALGVEAQDELVVISVGDGGDRHGAARDSRSESGGGRGSRPVRRFSRSRISSK